MDEKNEILINKLVEKSIEAFILGIEIYNKPTIKYRIEGFSFFICNAWELMLKSELIKRERNIYYPDKENRTFSLEKCIKEIFTDKYGALRNNLEQIIELRNTSSHYITEDYEYIYIPLFQACVINYISKIKEFHEIDISNYVSLNFINLSTKIEQIDEKEIKSKYTKEMSAKIIKDFNLVKNKIENSNNEFAIPIESRLYITKDKNNFDIAVRIDNNAKHNIAFVNTSIKDINKLYPYSTYDIVKLVNKKLKNKGILLRKIQKNDYIYTKFTKFDFNLFVTFYNIKSDEKMCFNYKKTSSYSYSQKTVDFLINEIIKNPENIIIDLKKSIKK